MIVAHGKAREASIECTIIRVDGTIERLGTVSYWHRNPLKRLAWRLRRWLGI
jgi:hypothetical protein